MNISKNLNWVLSIKSKRLASIAYKASKIFINVSAFFWLKCVETGVNFNSDVIISLTSFPERIDSVWMTIVTLLRQTKKPVKVILWLASEQFPDGDRVLPSKLIALKEFGLEIRYCEDIRPHKKYYYTMTNYPDYAVITVDDDTFYPETLVEELSNCAIKNPYAICCTWAHEILLDQINNIKLYKNWNLCTNGFQSPSMMLMPVGCGGVYYPAKSLNNEVFNMQAIKELCLNADDLWLKSMAIMNNTPSVRIDKKPLIFYSILATKSNGLYLENTGKNRNDVVMEAICKRYPLVLDILRFHQQQN